LITRDPLVNQLLSAYDSELKFKLFRYSGSFFGRWVKRLRLMLTLKFSKFDVLISTTHAADKEHLMVRASRAKKRFGIQTNIDAHDVSFDEVAPASRMIHEVERYNSLVELAGAAPDSAMPGLEIPTDAQVLATELIPEHSERICIAIHAGSGSFMVYKRWDIQNFAKLMDVLASRLNCQFFLFGGPDEIDLANSLASLVGSECVVLAGQTDLMTTIACLAKCDLLVSNDSGVSHLADVVSLKSVTVYGPTSEFKNRPTTAGSLTVRSESSYCEAERENICESCSPGYLASGEQPWCLNNLSVERVTDSVMKLVG
ncbi:glycosyltransferase family 9 protein, partial [Dehalococcoides mccartyi]|nr:glycosyltransferase family 9 protein [Dehalococcoides mccartyi]